MRDWSKVERLLIETDRELLQEFSDDYGKTYGALNVGCGSCIADAYLQLINFKPKKMSDCKYRMKAKYEGITLNNDPFRNSDLTNKKAERLLREHAAGLSLFDIFPEDAEKHVGSRPDDRNRTLAELRADHPDIKAKTKVLFLEKLAAQEADEEEDSGDGNDQDEEE